ncbi:MAG: hypothetical protein WCR42_09130 [bacterium]
MRENNQLECYFSMFHNDIYNSFKVFWANYKVNKNNEDEFVKNFYAPREVLIQYCNHNKMNSGSFGGILQEWTFKHFIQAGVDAFGLKDSVEVINGHQINFKWKEKGTTKLNIDIVIKSKKSTKLYCAFEIKTNFEDGFKKFRKEEKMIYHHRTKGYTHFKYYYISLSKPTPILCKDNLKDICTLIKRNELFVILKDKISSKAHKDFYQENYQNIGVESMLKNIYEGLEHIALNVKTQVTINCGEI